MLSKSKRPAPSRSFPVLIVVHDFRLGRNLKIEIMPSAEAFEYFMPRSSDESGTTTKTNDIPAAVFSYSVKATDLNLPPKDYFNFAGLPGEVLDRIYNLSCPAVKIFPSATSWVYKMRLEKHEEQTMFQPTLPPPISLVSRRLYLEVHAMCYTHGTHVLPTLQDLPKLLTIMEQKPKLFSSIQNFEVALTSSDLPPTYDPKELEGMFSSDAGRKGAKLLRSQDEILTVPDLVGDDPQSQWEHSIRLKDLLTTWECKKDLLLELIGPERLILRLDQAVCRGGCHRLHRCALFAWMSQGKYFPPGLRVKGLSPGEDLSDLVTGMGGTIGSAPIINEPTLRAILEERRPIPPYRR